MWLYFIAITFFSPFSLYYQHFLVLSYYELVSQLWNTWNLTNLYDRSYTNKVWLIDLMVRTIKYQKVEADVVGGARNSSTCFLSGVFGFFFPPSSKYWILFFSLSFILAEDSCLYTEAGGVAPSLPPPCLGCQVCLCARRRPSVSGVFTEVVHLFVSGCDLVVFQAVAPLLCMLSVAPSIHPSLHPRG